MEVAFPQQTTVRGERANPSLRMALTPGGRLSEALLFGKMQQLWPEMLLLKDYVEIYSPCQ
jgi:hypothetical protein